MRRVLWTLVPVGSLGLLGWVPPLRIAFRRKTLAGWLWFAASAASFVLVIVLTSTLHTSAVDDTPPTWVGGVEILNIIFTALYTAVASKALTPKPNTAQVAPQAWERAGYGYSYGPPIPAAPAQPAQAAPDYGYGRYPAAAAAYPSAAPADAPTTVTPPTVTPPTVAPNAMAAEVQAELRELRDLLGESAADRARDGRDVRGGQ